MYRYLFAEVNHKGDVIALDGEGKNGMLNVNDLADMGWQYEAHHMPGDGENWPILIFKKPNSDRARNIAEVEFSYIGGSPEAKLYDGPLRRESGANS